VGARHDAHFGAVVLVGLGGLAVEILKDVALAPAPVSPQGARAMIDSLASAPLFRGARGRPPLDVDAVVDAVVRISWLAADLGGRLVDLEVNPLIVDRAGAGAVAVDARASVRRVEE
jgi:acetyl-CoA synthetase (ADP-forming)